MSVVEIKIEKPYQESCNFAGMTGSGKSNCMEYVAQRLPKETAYTLFDLTRVHRYVPRNSAKQKIVYPNPHTFRDDVMERVKEIYYEGNHVVMIEEVDRYSTLHVMPKVLDDVINIGRNRRVSLWLSFRRPQRVHKDLIENAQHHFIFRMFGTAVDWYKDATGWRGVEQAKHLGAYDFIYWKVGKQPQICKKLKFVLQLP